MRMRAKEMRGRQKKEEISYSKSKVTEGVATHC
jgi:hypothetical protein